MFHSVGASNKTLALAVRALWRRDLRVRGLQLLQKVSPWSDVYGGPDGRREVIRAIDPVKRELLQFGYNQPIQGAPPLSAYAFYYYNSPGAFHQTNMTWRLALAPVYADAELGIRGIFDKDTDLASDWPAAGMPTAITKSARAIISSRNLHGNGISGSTSLYHLFNPDDRIPLNGILRAQIHFADYLKDDTTDPNFVLPKTDERECQDRFPVWRTGAGDVARPGMELSLWYEGSFRLAPESYGYNNDRSVRSSSHLFWGRALLTTRCGSKQTCH